LEEEGIRQGLIVGAEPNELDDGNIMSWCHEFLTDTGGGKEGRIKKRNRVSDEDLENDGQ
jgi:hypothetical protein